MLLNISIGRDRRANELTIKSFMPAFKSAALPAKRTSGSHGSTEARFPPILLKKLGRSASYII